VRTIKSQGRVETFSRGKQLAKSYPVREKIWFTANKNILRTLSQLGNFKLRKQIEQNQINKKIDIKGAQA
jgi:hypothetical protein